MVSRGSICLHGYACPPWQPRSTTKQPPLADGGHGRREGLPQGLHRLALTIDGPQDISPELGDRHRLAAVHPDGEIAGPLSHRLTWCFAW